MNNRLRLILASASPRRYELLQQLGLCFEVQTAAIDETYLPGERIDDYTKRLAIEKARSVYRRVSHQPGDRQSLVIGADTCGEIDGQLLNKPRDLADAKRLLGLMGGRKHSIYSAFALTDGRRLHAEVVCSTVTMRPISEAEITAYWRTGEPCDKAGAYAIQGRGAQFVSHLSGSYSAVMGLPLYELSQALAAWQRIT